MIRVILILFLLTSSANAVDLVTFLFYDAGTPLINALLDFRNS